MIVDDFNIVWPILAPRNAEPPLLVDPNAILSFAVPPASNAKIRFCDIVKGTVQIRVVGRYHIGAGGISSSAPTLSRWFIEADEIKYRRSQQEGNAQ